MPPLLLMRKVSMEEESVFDGVKSSEHLQSPPSTLTMERWELVPPARSPGRVLIALINGWPCSMFVAKAAGEESQLQKKKTWQRRRMCLLWKLGVREERGGGGAQFSVKDPYVGTVASCY